MIPPYSLSLSSTANRLRAIAEPTRLRLIKILAQGELTVSEISQILGQSQPRVSRHLKLLLNGGLVTRLPEGAWVFYRLADGREANPFPNLAKVLIESLDERDPMIAGDLGRLTEIKLFRSKEAAAYFDSHADEWSQIQSISQPVAEVEAAIIELLGSRTVEFLVDLGTGTGRVLEVLRGLYSRAIGFDTNHAMLGVARVNLDRADIRHAHVQHGNILSLPKLLDEPDVVVIHQVLHYLDSPAAAVLSAARLLSPNGRLLIVDFMPHELEFLRTEHAHRRLGFSDTEVFDWCHAAGLEPEEVRQILPVGETSTDRTYPAVSLWLSNRCQSSHVAEALKMAR